MSSREDKVRDSIAEAASEWFVSNDEAPLASAESSELVSWLTASPVHVEEFLGVAAVARELREAAADPELSIESLIARARRDEEPATLFSRSLSGGPGSKGRWQLAAAVLLAVGAATLGIAIFKGRPNLVQELPPVQSFSTAHGEQKRVTLPDGSVLVLNTDSAVTVSTSARERLVVLQAGEAAFEVAHEKRPFKVLAGSAAIVDLGTQFDVRLEQQTTRITVLEGKVSVASVPARGASVQLGINEQVRMDGANWPPAVLRVDAQAASAWLHRQIAFDHEHLERVAAEYNRYAAKPIAITAPELRSLEVSGTFSTDDPEELLAFLKSLEGVRVEVTATEIRVSSSRAAPTH